MEENKRNEKVALSVAGTLAEVAKLHLIQAANAIKYDRNPDASENFHYKEALEACARLDLFLCELGAGLPEEFDEYKTLVLRQKGIWEERYESIKRDVSVVDWRSRTGGSGLGWHIGKKSSSYVVRICEQVYDDDGAEKYELKLEKEMGKDDGIFSGIPKGIRSLECVIASQELSIDVERTMAASKVNKETVNGQETLQSLQRAANNAEILFLLQKLYESQGEKNG